MLLLIGFVLWELRPEHPLLDPADFPQRSLSAGSMSIFIQFFAFYGFTFIVLQYLQLVRGDTPLLAAVEMLPLAAAMMPTSRLSPRLVARFGTRGCARSAWCWSPPGWRSSPGWPPTAATSRWRVGWWSSGSGWAPR